MSQASKLAAYQEAAGEVDPVSMLRRLELPLDALRACIARAHERRVHAVVSVFTDALAAPACDARPDALKAASPDIVNRPLLDAFAKTGLPLILSSGTATPEEVRRARAHLHTARDRLAFLHCVSAYPTPADRANVAACRELARLVDPCPVGYSDHTSRTDTGLAAVRAGNAAILEKHFTDDRARPGPDHAASLEPEQFRAYAQLARADDDDATFDPRLTGDGAKTPADLENDVRRVSRQSLVALRAIPAGSAVERDNLTTKRPGTGIEPWRIDEIAGRTAARDIDADVPITDRDLA